MTYDRYIYIIIYENFTVRLTSVGLTQAHPNYIEIGPHGRNIKKNSITLDFGTKKRESKGREVVLRTLLKPLVKDKLLHSTNVPVNAELRPLRRDERKFSDTAL